MPKGKTCTTWKCRRREWDRASSRMWNIAASLSSKTPYGVNPSTRKQYSSAKVFAKALHAAEKKVASLQKITKTAYKKETGMKW